MKSGLVGIQDPQPLTPKHPERICWGCEKLCPVNHLNCRETRVPHPVELFGDSWRDDRMEINDSNWSPRR